MNSVDLPLPRNIFLLGRMCVGKDFAGSELTRQRGFTRLAFADALKNEVAAMRGVTREYLDANKAMFRDDLQLCGAARRAEDPNYWIRKWMDARANVKGPVVCTDCRHINESGFAASYPDSLIVKLQLGWHTRSERINSLYGAVGADRHDHPSESEVDQCIFHLILPGTLPAERIPGIIAKQYKGWQDMGCPRMMVIGVVK